MLASTYQSKPLTSLERNYVLLTQNGLPIIEKPFHWIAEQLAISVDEAIALTKSLKERGIIRRIAAVPNHYKLGYRYNGMTVWDVDDALASKIGQLIRNLPFVSHCYLRPRHLPQWNYNLFAMVHGKTPEEINDYRNQIKNRVEYALIDRSSDDVHQEVTTQSNDMLTSTKILKKTGLRLKNKAEKGE